MVMVLPENLVQSFEKVGGKIQYEFIRYYGKHSSPMALYDRPRGAQ
jgi:hypothetical protein